MQKIFNRPLLKDRRKQLRRASTDAELKLWQHVRAKRFAGLKFVRQFSVGPYILDFFCASLKLAIELDGCQHNESSQKEYDQVRTEYLNGLRIRVIRFWNHEVLKDIESVLATVEHALHTQIILTHPSRVLKRLNLHETPSSDEEGVGGV